ncbi:MAG: prohibitin family protein [Gemmatimonadaceae bacterium]|jgi:regulator of protease activity HflC (stomatin/prohibitin superfamily)|nr:prohibitin family protein [Gemmatimonadaceae bacterium]
MLRSRWLLLAALSPLATGCAIVRQDQVGIKRTLGRIDPKPRTAGAIAFLPGFQSVIKLPARTINREIRLALPAKEGVNVAADISILYRIDAAKAGEILEKSGADYEEVVIIPVFRAAAADVSARFYAKDLHSGERVVIEKAIKEQMASVLDNRGFVVENVLLKSITLPQGLARAIEEKLEAEQDALRMQFVLQREKQEAERKLIEAGGQRDAQKVLGEGLSPLILQFRSIEAFRELAKSSNAKVIITDGKAPVLVQP